MELTQKPASVFQNNDYLKLWMAYSISGFGSQFTIFALPLIATILLGSTPAQMGLLTSLGFLPNLLFSLFAGVWVDRFRRRPIIIAASLFNATALLAVPVLYFLDSLTITALIIVQFLVGTGTVFMTISANTYMPTLIKREQLIDGNSKIQLSTSVARIAGNGLGGSLVALLSAPVVIILDIATYLVSVIFLAAIQTKEEKRETKKEERDILKEMAEGMKAVFRSQIIRTILISSTWYNFFYSMFLPLFILYISSDLKLNPTYIGLIFAMGGVGALIGSTLAKPLSQKLGIGSLISKINILTGVSMVLMVLTTPFPIYIMLPLLLLAQILLSACATIYSINAVSLRTAVTPNHLLGRTNASLQAISFGVLALGPLIGGGIAELIGSEMMIILCGVGISLSAFVILLSPICSMKELPKGDELAKYTA
jgi:MFS family permease